MTMLSIGSLLFLLTTVCPIIRLRWLLAAYKAKELLDILIYFHV